MFHFLCKPFISVHKVRSIQKNVFLFILSCFYFKYWILVIDLKICWFSLMIISVICICFEIPFCTQLFPFLFCRKHLIADTWLLQDVAFVVDGWALEIALKHYRKAFTELAILSRTAICCRVTPSQKAQVL